MLNCLARENDGFSLIEIIFTIAIIAIVFVSALGYFINSINFTNQIEKRNQAIKIATNTMENLKLNLLNNWDDLDFSKYNDLDNVVDDKYSLKANNFVIESKKEDIDIDDDNNDDSRIITVTISWDDSKHKLVLRSLVVKR